MHVARSEFVLGTCLGALAGEAPGGGSSDARVTTVVQIKQRAAVTQLSEHLIPHLLARPTAQRHARESTKAHNSISTHARTPIYVNHPALVSEQTYLHTC